MSRIDKALRAWEDSVGLARPDDDAIPRSGRTVVGDYAVEAPPEREAPTPPEPQPQRWTTPLEVPAEIPRPSDRDAAARLVKASTTSAVSVEQYRRLAATLHEVQVSNGLKTVMLTSSVPNEGKTLTSVNLAVTLSDSYARRVLLIDADLRWPCLHTLLGLGNTSGLSEVLAEEPPELPLVQVSDRLSVLTAGQPGPTPLAGLSSPRMRALLEECGRRFDWVLLDTPPVGVLPDAQLLARLAGAVVLVIGAGSTPAAIVERSVAELGPECIIGTVLNRVDRHAISEAGYIDRYHAQRHQPTPS
jgi:capsular exopolysaccharide synthesis family protein